MIRNFINRKTERFRISYVNCSRHHSKRHKTQIKFEAILWDNFVGKIVLRVKVSLKSRKKNIKQCIFYVLINLLTDNSKKIAKKGGWLACSDLIFDLFFNVTARKIPWKSKSPWDWVFHEFFWLATAMSKNRSNNKPEHTNKVPFFCQIFRIISQ